MSKNRVVNVGIDLGTSRSVISGSNGIRTFISSYVGYPKDAISRKFVGENMVFGDKALKNRMALNLFRPFNKGILKSAEVVDEDSDEYRTAVNVAREILKHLVDQVLKDEPEGTRARGVIGTPALSSRKNKKSLIDLTTGILESVMIASEPFTVAYGLGIFSNAIIADIGAGTIDLCRMSGAMPTEEDQVTITKAGDYIDQVFLDLINKKYKDVDLNVNMVKRFKEENATLTPSGEELFITVPVKGKPTKLNVTKEIKEACQTVVPDIVNGIAGLVASFDPEFQSELKDNIILAGGGSQMIGLQREIEKYMIENLGTGKVSKVEEPLYAGANGALMLCKDMPDEYWHELDTSALVSGNKNEEADK